MRYRRSLAGARAEEEVSVAAVRDETHSGTESVEGRMAEGPTIIDVTETERDWWDVPRPTYRGGQNLLTDEEVADLARGVLPLLGPAG